MRITLFFAAWMGLFFPLHLWAQACPSKPQMLFFGGYGASQTQVDSWASQAQATYPYSEQYDFKGISYAGSQWSNSGVVANNQALINQWVHTIDSAPANCRFVLAGHSSGSAISNAIAAQIHDKAKAQLIVLDGFNPQSTGVKTTCWSAPGARNTSAMNSCPSHELTGTAGCGNDSMCRHFALLNKGAGAAGVNGSNYKSTGYSHLEVNLDWLPQNTSTPASPTTPAGTR